MDDGLKQRLVGALVLAAVGVIFLPSLFDRDGSRMVDLSTQVPPEPVVVAEPLVIPLPRPPEGIDPAASLAESYSHPEETVPAVASTEPLQDSPLNAQGVPDAWSIQVASFSEASRAESMLQALVDKGYKKSYLREVSGEQGKVYRVFVGPKMNRQLAEAEQAELDKAFKIKSLLVKFQP